MTNKKKLKYAVALTLIVLMWSIVGFTAFASEPVNPTGSLKVTNASYLTITGENSYKSDNGSVSLSGSDITATAQGYDSSGCGNNVPSTTTVTIKNRYDYPILVAFTKGRNVSCNESSPKELATNASFTFTVSSGKGPNSTVSGTMTINSITVKPITAAAATADPSMGTASASPSGSIEPGTSVTFTATALDGFQFDYWKNASGNKVSTENPYTITVTENTALTAVFKTLVSDVDISVSILSDSCGTVTMDGSTVFSGLGGKQTVSVNTEHTLVATPNEGYVFAGWLNGSYSDLGSALMSGTPSGDATKSISVGYNDLAYTAIFVRRNSYSVSVDDSVKGTATVQRNEETPSETSVAAVLSQTITYTATAKSGYVFEGWYAGVRRVSTDPVYSFTVLDEGDLQLQARFREPQLSLALGPGLSSIDVNIGGAAQTIAGAETFSVPSGTSVTVTGQVASGYTFYQWQRGTSSVSTSASYTFTLTGDTELTGFTKNSSDTVAGVCKNVSTGNIYATVEEGVAAATSGQTVVLIADATVTQSFTIPSGVTLLIPYGSETSADYSKKTTNNISIGNVKYTLTVPQGVTVNVQGTLCVNAMQGTASTQRTGNIAGDYGKMLLDGELTVSGTLRAYGIISGSGSITAQSSASVYQYLEMTDYRGGGTASKIYKSMFPINQFYIQNIQVTTTYQYGSKLYGHWYVYVPTIRREFTGTEMIVGPSTEKRVFFKVSSGDIVWHYNASRAKSIVELYGSAAVSSLKISVSAVITTIDMDSAKVECPLSGAFDVTVKSGANVDMANQFKILPGGKITVEDGGTLNVSSNLYLYDVADYKAATWNFGGYRVKPLTAGGGSITETEDGQLEVNGTLNVTGSGKIYSSSGAGNASSSVITTENTGKIVFQGAAAGSATIKECENNDESASAVGNFDGARGKFAETGTWDKFAGSTTYYSNGEAWYLYKITYYNNGTIVGYDYTAGGNVTRNLSTFSGADASVISGTATANVSGGTLTLSGIGSNVSVNVTGTINTYIPTFVLNETQYANYRTFTGGTLSDTVTINGSTYHVVLTRQAAAYNSPTTAPTNVAMGVTTSNANSIAWYLSDSKDGTEFAGTVPEGETAGGPVYIYGIYTGAVAYNSFTGQLYTTLEDAFASLPGVGNATISMVNNCGSYADEDATLPYHVDTKGRITFDLNGFHAVGRIINNSNLTIDLNGGTLDYHSGATAANQAYRTMAAVTNNGTLTIKDTAGGGKITTDAIEDNNSIQNYISVVRNLGILSMDGVTMSIGQTVNDYSAVVLNYNGGVITTINNASLVCTKGYGIVNYGGTIQTISGGSINGGSANTAGRYGIMNRNYLATDYSSASGSTIGELGAIGVITNVTIDVNRYGIYNNGIINEISGTSTILATPDSAQDDTPDSAIDGNVQGYAIYNSNGWYYDTALKKRTDDTSTGVLVRTDVYDTVNKPTIGKITGNVTVTAINTSTNVDHGVALYNAGRINEISENATFRTSVHPSNTKITYSRYAIQNSSGGIIDLITGNAVFEAGARAIRNIGQATAKQVSTYSETTTSTTIMNQVTEYQGSEIKEINGSVTITTTGSDGYGIENYRQIGKITGNVKIQAVTNTVANLDSDVNQYLKLEQVRSKASATNSVVDLAVVTKNYTYTPSSIGEISDGVVIKTVSSSNAILNRGQIDILRSITVDAANQYAIRNGNDNLSTCCQTRETKAWYSASGNSGEKDISRTFYSPEIKTISDVTLRAASYVIENRGLIGEINNSKIVSGTISGTVNTASGECAISNRSYMRSSLTYTYDCTLNDSSVPVATTATTRQEYKPSKICSIGAGNTLLATTNTIYNSGTIDEIDGGKTTTVTAKTGVALYNYQGTTALSEKVGTDTTTTYASASIGAVKNVIIQGQTYAILNGDANATYKNLSIAELGEGVEATSTGSYAVYNQTYASIGAITGGIYTASASGKHAVYNNNTSAPITISDGDFKGGTNNDASLGRNYAIYDPDNPARQTYPTDMKLTSAGVTRSVTFADGTPATGYYYLGPATVVAQFVGGAAGEFATLQAAVAAYPNTGMDGSTYIQMTDNSTEAGFTIGKNVYLDLNGKTVTLKDGTGATGTLTINKDCTLYGMDSSVSKDYVTAPSGKIVGKVTGTVAPTYETPKVTTTDGDTYDRYVAIPGTEADGNTPNLSFHHFNISVTGYRFELKAPECALFFIGKFQGDEAAKNHLTKLGFTLKDNNNNLLGEDNYVFTADTVIPDMPADGKESTSEVVRSGDAFLFEVYLKRSFEKDKPAAYTEKIIATAQAMFKNNGTQDSEPKQWSFEDAWKNPGELDTAQQKILDKFLKELGITKQAE